jgi:hypothetical protein
VNHAQLDPNTSLDAVTIGDGRTQLALRDGPALFDVGYLAPGEMFEVGTPYGAVDFNQPGLYNIGISNDCAIVSAFSGLAQVVGLGGSGQISKGEMLTLLGQTAAQATLSHLDRRNAGYQVDDYYRYLAITVHVLPVAVRIKIVYPWLATTRGGWGQQFGLTLNLTGMICG